MYNPYEVENKESKFFSLNFSHEYDVVFVDRLKAAHFFFRFEPGQQPST